MILILLSPCVQSRPLRHRRDSALCTAAHQAAEGKRGGSPCRSRSFEPPFLFKLTTRRAAASTRKMRPSKAADKKAKPLGTPVHRFRKRAFDKFEIVVGRNGEKPNILPREHGAKTRLCGHAVFLGKRAHKVAPDEKSPFRLPDIVVQSSDATVVLSLHLRSIFSSGHSQFRIRSVS